MLRVSLNLLHNLGGELIETLVDFRVFILILDVGVIDLIQFLNVNSFRVVPHFDIGAAHFSTQNNLIIKIENMTEYDMSIQSSGLLTPINIYDMPLSPSKDEHIKVKLSEKSHFVPRATLQDRTRLRQHDMLRLIDTSLKIS